MTDIAIVIGVSTYNDAKYDLPGSKNDAEAIHTILKKTERFKDILYLNSNDNSKKIKASLTHFIEKYKETGINELFLYYSGHGIFDNGEFYYCLSDYDPEKTNETTLKNSDIDKFIKSISPKLVVKVIDACQSGTLYVKGPHVKEVIKDYNSDENGTFKICYFLCSCSILQASFANNNYSYFTASFINAIYNHTSKKIGYRDIIDSIINDFSNDERQTPFFISQHNRNDIFCSVSDDLKDYISSLKNKMDDKLDLNVGQKNKGESMSIFFKKAHTFEKELRKIFPRHEFNKRYVLEYIANCTKILLKVANTRFPERKLAYINPIFIKNRNIYPAPNLSGNNNIIEMVNLLLQLIKAEIIFPFSIPLLEKNLSGICLFNGYDKNDLNYDSFKSYDLDNIQHDIALISGKIHEDYLIGELKKIVINQKVYSDDFKKLAFELDIDSPEDKVKLKKTLIVYKHVTKILNGTSFISFVNKFNHHSFFDCIITLVSEKPFDEHELWDFANVIENFSAPLADYFEKNHFTDSNFK